MQRVISPFYLLTPGEDNIDSILNRLHTTHHSGIHSVFINRPTSHPIVAIPEKIIPIRESKPRMIEGVVSSRLTKPIPNNPLTSAIVRMPLPRIFPFCSKNHRFNHFCIEFSPSFVWFFCEESKCFRSRKHIAPHKVGKKATCCGINVLRKRQYTNYIMYGSINSLW